MKVVSCLWTILLVGIVQAQFASLPTCARSCLISALPGNCNSQVDCICLNVDWDAISSCVCSSCSSTDQTRSFRAASSACQNADVDIPSTCPSRSTTITRVSSSRTPTSTRSTSTDTSTSTADPTPTSTPTPKPAVADGLSTGAKVGIGIGSALGALAVIGGLILLFALHMRKSRKDHEESRALRASQTQMTWAAARAELAESPFIDQSEVTEQPSHGDTQRWSRVPTEHGIDDPSAPRGSWLTGPQPGIGTPRISRHY